MVQGLVQYMHNPILGAQEEFLDTKFHSYIKYVAHALSPCQEHCAIALL